MTLKELLDSKLIYDNIEVFIDKREVEKICIAVRVFNRPVELKDFKPAIPTEWLSREVDCVTGSYDTFKVAIILK